MNHGQLPTQDPNTGLIRPKSHKLSVTAVEILTPLDWFQTSVGQPLYKQHNHLLMQHGEMRHSSNGSQRESQ